MAQHGDRARESLLDAAEELFAVHGMDAVSNRRIAERAGTANHSAVKYHFGGRDEMVGALLGRSRDAVRSRRADVISSLPTDPTLHQVVASGVLPWVDYLADCPTPCWRARFTYQAMSLPSVESSLREGIEKSVLADGMLDGVAELAHVPHEVLIPRTRIVAGMVLGLCANYEAEVAEDTAVGGWTALGYFIVDAATGMLAAPVTSVSPP